jgi:DNA-binding MarR family transcriptional regulator
MIYDKNGDESGQDEITLKDLSKPVIETLIFLHENPEGLKKSDFRKKNIELDWDGMSPNSAVKFQKVLLNQKLIRFKTDPKYDIFVLTERGVEIARCLKAINAILEKRQLQILLENDLANAIELKKEGHLILKLLEAINIAKKIYQIPIAGLKDSNIPYSEQNKIDQFVQQHVNEIEAILKLVELYIKEQNLIISMKRMNELIGSVIPKKEKTLQKMTRPVFDLLLYLLDHPEGLQKSEFRGKDDDGNWGGMSPNTGVRIHKLLYEKNVIERVFDEGNLNKINYTLTEDGVLIAEYLRVIEHLLYKSIYDSQEGSKYVPPDDLNSLFVVSEGGKIQTYLLEAIDLLIQRSHNPVIELENEKILIGKLEHLKNLVEISKSHLMKKVKSELLGLRFNRILT